MRPVLLAVALAGCGKIYVDPVSIEAKAEPPAVMLLFDKSGSMAQPLDPGAACGSCVFPGCDETRCATRMGVARAWATDMLGLLGTKASWGLTIFPADNVCAPAAASQVLTAVPSSPTTGSEVAMKLQLLTPGGGTPTAASLAFVGQTFPSSTAERIVVLFTDGDPNCSSTNANTCVTPAACRCTLSGGNCGTLVNDADPSNFCRRGCLDEDGAVEALRALATFGVSTTVIAFGADTNLTTVNAMAQAGLSGTRCLTDSDCFGNACQGSTCVGGALVARDGPGLGTVTAALQARFEVATRCRWTLLAELPNGPTAVQVAMRDVPATDWVLETPSRIRFLGATCKALVDDRTLTPKFVGQP